MVNRGTIKTTETETPFSILDFCAGKIPGPAVDQESIHYDREQHRLLRSAEDHHFWFVSRRNLLLRLLKKHLPRPLPGGVNEGPGLDAGCGTGSVADFLTSNGFRTFGVDAHWRAENSGEFQSGRFGALDLCRVDPAEEFDFVLLLDVIEHLDDPGEVLRRAIRALKPGGLIIVTVPALRSIWSEFDVMAGHRKRYDREDLRRELDRELDTARGIPKMETLELSYFFGMAMLPMILKRWQGRLRRQRIDENVQEQLRVTPWINQVLLAASELENRLGFAAGLRTPRGSSLLWVGRKSVATGRP